MAHKDFDSERVERWQEGLLTFTIGGDEYTVRPSVDPRALAKYDEMDPTSITNDEAFAIMDEVICAFILPGQAERWHAARGRTLESLGIGPDASRDEVIEASRKCIDLAAVMDVIPWLMEEVTGRPLPQPGDSTGSPDTSGTPSTDSSPLPESMPEPSISGGS